MALSFCANSEAGNSGSEGVSNSENDLLVLSRVDENGEMGSLLKVIMDHSLIPYDQPSNSATYWQKPSVSVNLGFIYLRNLKNCFQ